MLPGFSPAFKAFIEPAKQRSEIWRTLLGVLLVVLLFAVLNILVFGSTFLIVENMRMGLGYKYIIEFRNGREVSAIIIGMIMNAMFIPALWIVLRLLHKRPLLSLVSPNGKFDWPVWKTAVLIFFCILAVSFTVSYFTADIVQQMPFSQWLIWLAPVLFLIFLQSGAEELLFRGYLQQQLAARFNSRIIWWFIPSLLFGFLHFDTSSFGDNAYLVVAYTTFVGLILADITARFGSLSAAMGLHFANNAFMLVLNAPDQMSGASLYLQQTDLKSQQAAFEIAISIGFIIVGYLVFLTIMHRRRM